jgi:hypothetical protein
MSNIERLEDWPPALHDILSRGLRQRFIDSETGTFWHFDEERMDPLNPEVRNFFRNLKLDFREAIILVSWTPRDPKHLYEIIGHRPPADGFGEVSYRPVGSAEIRSLIARRACVYTAGSMVIGEIAEGGLDRIVNPSYARLGRHKDIADANNGLRHLLHIAKHAGGRPATANADALAEAVQLCRDWLADHPGRTLADFSRADLADRLCIQPKSLDERMRAKRFTMKMVREQIR